MANVDGKIRIGLELSTNQFKSSISILEKEYQKISKAFSGLANELESTGDMSAFKKGAEGLTKAFIATNTAMSDLLEKAKASSKISLVDLHSSTKDLQSFKSKVGDAIEYLEKNGVELNVGLDTDLSKEYKSIYTKLRTEMNGISLDTDIVPNIDTRKMTSQSSGGTIQQGLSTDEALLQLEQDQMRAVEKFNEARRQGVDISQALTQNEIALTRSYYEGLKAEERRNQERAKAAQASSKQQKVDKFNTKVDSVVASAVIDLPKEESKIERLNRLAEEVKADFANEAEISQVKSKIGELKRLASEIKIELTYNNNLSAISNQLGTVKKAADGIRFNFAKTGDIEQARTGVEALKNKISELKAQRDSLNDAYEKGIISEIEFRADTADIDRAIDELESETVQIEAEINASSSNTMDLSGIADSLSGKFGKVKMVLSATVEAMKKLFEFADYMVGEFEEAVDTAKKLNSALKKVASTSFDLSRGILAFSHDALEALGITEQLDDTMSSIGFGDLVGADLLADVIRELSSALKDFSNDALDSGSAFQSYYLRISDIFGESKKVIYDYAKTSTDMLGMSETAYMEAASKIGIFAKGYIKDTEDLTNVTAGLTTAIADLSAQTGFTINETMTKMLSGIRGNTEAIEELGINVKVADLQTWLDTEGINAKFENLNSTMQNLYRTWYVLDKVQSNGTMGYASKMMGTYSGQVRILQAQLDDLRTTIGTYLMQALVPVLQLANMILSRLIDIANMVGKAFGFLDKYSFADSLGAPDTSGVSDIYSSATDSITGATTAQEDLAKATDKTAKAAKKALAPFHQLNILQNNNDSSSSSPKVPGAGGLGSVVETIPALDTKPAETAVSEWVQALKDAIEAGAWYDVGRLLGEKVNQIVAKLDFKKYREKLYNGALNLAEIFNGLIETIHFDEIGNKLGDAINTIVNTINLFLDRINFEEVGTSISDFLRGLLATAEWDEIGRLWSQKTRILTDIFHGFVEDMSTVDLETGTSGWQELGIAFGEFVTGALDLEWERLGTDIALAMNGVADALISFNDTVDFAGIASRLATGFNNLVSTIDGAKLGQSIADTLNSAIGAVGTFLSEANFLKLGMEIGNALGTALANIDWSEAANTAIALADGIVSLLAGAVYTLSQNYDKIFAGVQSFATSIIDWINDPANQDAIAGAVNNFVDMLVGLVSAIDWKKLYKGIGDTLSKIDWADIIYLMHLGEGIGASFKSIFSKSMLGSVIKVGLEFVGELFKELGSGILKAIKGLVGLVGIVLLGIPATLLAKVIQIGASIVDGIIEGITGKASNLREQVDAFFQSVIDWVKDLFGIHSPSTVFAEIGGYLIEGLIQGIKSFWGSLTEFFSTSISTLITNVTTWFSSIGTAIGGVFNGVTETLATAWETITTWFETAVTTLVTNVTTWFSGLGTAISGVFTNIQTVITTIWTNITTWLSTTITTLVTKISTWFTTLWTSITTIFTAIYTTAVTIWNNITTWLSTTITTLVINISTWFSEIATTISTVFTNVYNFIVTIWTTISTWLSTTISTIVTNVTTWFTTLEASITTIFTAIYTTAVTIWTTLKTSIETIVTTLKTTLTTIITDIQTAITTAFTNIKTAVTTIVTTLKTSVEGVFTELKTSVTSIFNSIKENVTTAFTNIKTAVTTIVTTLKTSVEGVFTALKTNVTNTFNSIKETVISVFNGIKEGIKSPINAIIGFVESMCNGLIKGINTAINALNSLSISVPDWVPDIGGKTFGFNIATLSTVSIPRLADGAVIQPNHRFLAELGDQTKGVNIETPLSTMLDAFRGALADGNYGSGGDITIPVYIGSELIDEIIVDANNRDTYRNNGR